LDPEAPDLSGHVALVTGGGSGIGRAIALSLARSGAAIAVSGRRRPPLEETVAAIEAAGERGLAVTGDVALAADAQRMVTETAHAFGGLHIVVNNAGVAHAGPPGEQDPETIDRLIDIDLKGPIHVTHAALAFLGTNRDAGGSAVVNVSSSVTQHPVPGYSVYAAAKAGLDMLTRGWARELAAQRIRVNAVCPGVVRTAIHDLRGSPAEVAMFLRMVGKQTPLGRVGEPDDIARLVRFLASPRGDWITGAVIPIDGGLSLL